MEGITLSRRSLIFDPRVRARLGQALDDWAAGLGLEMVAMGIGKEGYFSSPHSPTLRWQPHFEVQLSGPGLPEPATIRTSVSPELADQPQNLIKILVSQLTSAAVCLRTGKSR